MRHKIIAVGKLREKYLRQGAAEYTKRLLPFGAVDLIEVAPEKTIGILSSAEEEDIKAREAERLLKQLKPSDYLVALAVEGKNMSSESLAAHLDNLSVHGIGTVNWVIGGHLGLAGEVTDRADLCLSLSRLTLPHQLARLVLLEQIYRTAKINAGQPYHR